MKLFALIILISLASLLTRAQEVQPKALGLTASFPWINNFHYHNYDTHRGNSKSGFIGVDVAPYYKWGKNKISINIGLTGSLPVPMGPYDYWTDSASSMIFSHFLEAMYHRNVYKRINILAGINYMEYIFNFEGPVNARVHYSQTNQTIGLTTGAEYRFSKNSAIALIYRPAIICFDVQQYMHVISIDARFDFNIWKKKVRKD